jgi:hypothetical protein
MREKIKSELGQALPLVLIAVMIGALVIPPFLGHAGTGLIGSRYYAQAVYAQYAADSGAEHAIWGLAYGGLADNISEPGTSVNYDPGESINGLPVSVAVCFGWYVIAEDDFESGGFTGGSGWLDNWYYQGHAGVTGSGSPLEGSYHLQLQNGDGYVRRSVDLSGEVDVRLRFWAKADSFESGDSADCLVSSNGIDWQTVHTWTSADSDNVYRDYEIDLTPYSLSGEFWIAFDANMNNNNDYFYVDQLEIVWPCSEYKTIAGDDFESGNWTGGSGWLDDWYYEGDAAVTSEDLPHSGSYHLRLRDSTGYVARPIDLSGEAGVHLQFWAKANSFQPGATVSCLVSTDGTHWTTVYTWDNGDDDNIYHYYNLDLTPYGFSSDYWIAFDANLANAWDYFYVDDIVVKSIHGYGITSQAGDTTLKATVNLEGGNVEILTWYLL